MWENESWNEKADGKELHVWCSGRVRITMGGSNVAVKRAKEGGWEFDFESAIG